MTSQLRIEMFGGLSVECNGARTTRFATQKTAALLAYLARYPGKSHLRDGLAEMLWPETDSARGRARLCTLLTYVRSVVEPQGTVTGSVLQTDRNTVTLNSDLIWSDAAHFEALLARVAKSGDVSDRIRMLQEARSLYRGDLLPGFYMDWVVREQARLHELYVDLLHALAHCLISTARRSEAITILDLALGADPYRESLVRMQMRCFAALGRPEAALTAFEQFVERLRQTLGARPSESTLALGERIRSDPEAFDSADEETPMQAAAPVVAVAAPVKSAEEPTATVRPELPFQLTRFVGRNRELDALTELLCSRDCRLVTLTGPGGVGKTRLSIEAARVVSDAFRGRVWFVELARISHARLFPFALSESLKLSGSGPSDPLDQSVERLKQAPCLLVLDNFEHLLAEAAVPNKIENALGNSAIGLVRLLLERVPELTCLVTSRQPLRLGGEQEIPVDQLRVPTVGEPLERAAGCESLALYVDRAKVSRPDFALSNHNFASVAELCRRLEGLPLAIEMAAAWSKTVTPARMLELIGSRPQALTARRRDLPARHQSMRAAIAWSYDLLDEKLRRLFCSLSVFRGGWTAEDAAFVAGHDDIDGDLAELAERSMILIEEHNGTSRFRQLELLRIFAKDQLSSSDEECTLRDRHYTRFLNLAKSAQDRLNGPDASFWFARLGAEHDNFRLALEQAHDGATCLTLATALWRYWNDRGYYAEASLWLARGIEECDCESEHAALRARGLTALGATASNQGEYSRARAFFREAMDLWRSAGDREGIGDVHNNLGALEYRCHNFEVARVEFDSALAIRRELGDNFRISATLNNLAILACDVGDFFEAEQRHAENLELKRTINDGPGIALALGNLGHLAYRQRQYARARMLLQESIAEHRSLDMRPGIAVTLHTLGNMELIQGHLTEALEAYTESLEIFSEIGEKRGVAYSLGQISGVVLRLGDAERAVQCAARAEQMCRELNDGAGLVGAWIRLGDALIHTDVREAEARLRQALETGAEIGDESLQTSAIESLAYLASVNDDHRRAAILFAFAGRTPGNSYLAGDDVGWEKARLAIRAVLGEDEMERIVREGSALSLSEAVDHALARPAQCPRNS